MSDKGARRTYPTREELRRLADEDRHTELGLRLKDRTTSVAIATALDRKKETQERERLKQRVQGEDGGAASHSLPRNVLRLILDAEQRGAGQSRVCVPRALRRLLLAREVRARAARPVFHVGRELPPGFPEGTRMVPWKAFYNVMHTFHRHLADEVFRSRSELEYEGQVVSFAHLGENKYRKTTTAICVDMSSYLSDVVISFDRFLRVCYGWTLRSFVKQLVEDTRYAATLSDSAADFFLIALRAGDTTQTLTLPTRPKLRYLFATNVGASLSLFDLFKHERPPRSR